jgi:hypothetical protein
MHVSTAGEYRDPRIADIGLPEPLGEDFGAVEAALLTLNEIGPGGHLEGHCLGGDDVLQRSALLTGKDRRVDLLGDVRLVGQDESAARTSEGLDVVDVTTWACGTGEGCSPAATNPAKCAMSTIR